MKKQDKLTKLGEDTYNSLVERGGYVKGYGSLYRVMDATHHAIFNVPVNDVKFLITKGVLYQDEMVFVLDENHEKIFKQILISNEQKPKTRARAKA